MTEKPTPKPIRKLTRSEQRQARLERALRENLKKRKELARKRSAGDGQDSDIEVETEAVPVIKD